MQTPFGHLTYCTNIHPGEHWSDHFSVLKQVIPPVKDQISRSSAFGIGLRLSHTACEELSIKENLEAFKQWLAQANCYVFTMNGFPYGGFHHKKVKDLVHKPDWTTHERVHYTLQLFHLLSSLLPKDMEGGISTSPLSYKHWHSSSPQERNLIIEKATLNIMKVIEALIQYRGDHAQMLHLDIEPEPDGLIENGKQFVEWYESFLLPLGIGHLKKKFGYTSNQAEEAIKNHVQLCYDICHFAVSFEDHAQTLNQLASKGIKVGKIQISAALKARMAASLQERKDVIEAFKSFNESTYLHQVVALQQNGELMHYPDLPEALQDGENPITREWRAHFHVPLFIQHYGALQSTQEDILKVLAIQQIQKFTQHLEVETYTWEVLPEQLKLPITESIIRELEWVKNVLT
jgi:hypothetical protein